MRKTKRQSVKHFIKLNFEIIYYAIPSYKRHSIFMIIISDFERL